MSPRRRLFECYDGLSRRTAITSTPAGGGTATTTSYIWCGTAICQARNAGGATTREYYTEGELVPGSPAQPYYYGVDQIGSVRRAFASTSSAPAFSYDVYGNALQTTAPVTDFNYAGMFYNADSGLYLTQYRVYDPVSGRWLSRDPLGEARNIPANLYSYANLNPITLIDPKGLAGAESGEEGEETDNENWEENTEVPNSTSGPISSPPQTAECTPGSPQGEPDLNKLNHIFGTPWHNLDPLVDLYGSRANAYNAIEQALLEQGLTGTGTYSRIVNVGGRNVVVTGAYVNGVPRIGTAYIP